MNYLSFDVGIKNLAYCCLTPEKKIVSWGIINLNENPICCVNKRKPCTKQASYVQTIDGEEKYYCTAHSKGEKKCKKINSNYDILGMSKICIRKLREIDISQCKYVLIENQPALKNPTMKSVQMIIYTFFVMEGVLNTQCPVEMIHMVNARNKLKVYKGPPVESPYSNDKKNKYKNNKYLSVIYTGNMIKDEDEIFITQFNESKKKDDLADAYLQGIYWIEK